MKYDPLIHLRRSIRLRDYDYSQPGMYLVTIVTHQRECLFGEVVEGEMNINNYGRIVDECWHTILEHFSIVELGAYVVMPNHIHGIIIIADVHPRADAFASARRGTPWRAPTDNLEKFGRPVPGSLANIIRQYKSSVTRKIVQQLGGAPNIWQRNYFEHIIRDPDDLNRITRYIESNPTAWEADEENPRHKDNHI